MTNPSVSIIIPVYNVDKYLSQCLNSILKQSFKQFEVLCIDDGSTDNSVSIIEKYLKDSRFKLICQTNMGPGIARNVGIKESKGKFILFMDPDDWYPDETVIETLHSKIVESGCLVCGGSLAFFNSELNKFTDEVPKATFKSDEQLNFADYQYDYFFQRFIYDSNFLKSNSLYFENLRRYQDVIFFLNVMSKAKKFYSIEKTTYAYRGNNHKSTFFTKNKIIDWLTGMKKAITLSAREKWYDIHYKTIMQLTYDNFLEATSNLRVTFDKEYYETINDVVNIIDWKKLQYVDYSIDSYYPKYKIFFNGFFWDINNNTDIDAYEYIKNIKNRFGSIEFVKSLIYNNIGLKEKMIPILRSIEKERCSRDIKTIGIFNESMNVGGVERCISLIIPIFQEMGYNVILFTENHPNDDQFVINADVKRVVLPGRNQNNRLEWVERVDVLVKSALDNNIDVLYYNSYWKENIAFDGIICNQILKIPFIIHHHNVFSAMLARNNDFFYRACDYYSFANCIIALSNVDVLYFRSKGLASIYIPNPSNYFNKVDLPRDRNKIIWVGRFVPNHKQPIEALKIINIVIRYNPNVKLYMIGDGESTVKEELLNYVKKHNLSSNVTFTGFIKDMQQEYATASIMLMTSRIEGFPMAVVECKSQGLPLIAYDLPYVEMIRDNEGVIRVPNGDVKAAAKAILSLINNESEINKLSQRCTSSLNNYSDQIIKRKWNEVINIMNSNNYSNLLRLNPSDEDITILINTISQHGNNPKTSSNRPMISHTNSPSISIINYIKHGIKGIIKLLNKNKKIFIGKKEEMLSDHWLNFDDFSTIHADMIVSAGTGARIMHNLSINNKRSKFYLPLDNFGDYPLDSIIKMIKIGPESLFVNYIERGKDSNYIIVEDHLNQIISRKQFLENVDFETTRSELISNEQRKINKISDALNSEKYCTIIMCNRHNMNEIKDFGNKLTAIFPNSRFIILSIYNYPELNKDIMYKQIIDTNNLKIIRIAMNDNSENKWSGNTDNWKKLLNKIVVRN